MSEAFPEEEPSVLISAKALRILVNVAWDNPQSWLTIEPNALAEASDEAESALERYK